MGEKGSHRSLDLLRAIVRVFGHSLLALARQGHLVLLPPVAGAVGALVVGSIAGNGWPIAEKYFVFAALMAAFLAEGSAIWPAAFISWK